MSARRRYLAELADLWRLAVPVIVSRAGIMTMQLVDTIVVAHYAAEELAYQSLANAVTGGVIATFIGLLLGTMVMSSQAFGARRLEECGAAWRRSLPYAGGLGLAAAAIGCFGESFLRLVGQAPEVAAGGGAVMLVFALALPAVLLFVTTTFFLEGIRRPLPGMVVMIAGNVLNLALNLVFVFGLLGLPEGGAIGSAWATTVVRWAMLAALLAYVFRMPGGAAFAVRGKLLFRWAEGTAQRRLGYGAATSIGVECASFGALTIFAGWLGILPLAASSIVLNIVATIFMVALGTGSATGVRVGIAVGRRDPEAVARAGWTGLLACAAAMALLALLLGLAPASLAALYTAEPALHGLAASVIALCAFLLIPDGGQVVMAYALRGRGDNLVPTLLHMTSYLVVMLPLSWFLAFPMGHGVAGLWEGAILASVFSVGVLALRFAWLNRAARAGFTQEDPLATETDNGRIVEDRGRAEAA